MALGYCEALLRHLKEVANGNAPSNKITPPGYLKSLLISSPGAQVINQGTQQANGHVTDMRIKYRTRGVAGQTSTDDTCDIDVRPAYSEVTTSLTKFRKLAIFIDDETLAHYCADATNMVNVGTPATQLMRDHLDAITELANGFFADVDADLLAVQNTNFGVNIRTGNNAAAAINFSKDVTIQALNNGVAQILADVMDNEMTGTPIIVGSGLFNNYNLLQRFKSADQSGINTQLMESAYNFFYDRQTASAFGANEILVYSPGSILLLERNKYQGFRAGEKGTSFFFTMTLPVVDSIGDRTLGLFKFDAQLKYYDCPIEVNVAGYDTPQAIDRGWVLILSKTFDQFNIPANAYNAADVLTGNNGTLNYLITNDCDEC